LFAGRVKDGERHRRLRRTRGRQGIDDVERCHELTLNVPAVGRRRLHLNNDPVENRECVFMRGDEEIRLSRLGAAKQDRVVTTQADARLIELQTTSSPITTRCRLSNAQLCQMRAQAL
jgi:hypothetical protein